MNRIEKLFSEKKKNILSVFFTAGYPHLEDTENIICELQNAGADMIEIGIPFSDPMADGPTIQQSSHVALENGMTLHKLFEQLKNIRERINIPLILMGYLNPVLHFGIEDFCKECRNIGIDGIILPDLPLKEYQDEYKNIFEKNGLLNIFMITPQTSEIRIKQIDEASRGFIYMVSSSATTGAAGQISDEQIKYFERIKSLNLENPCLIGFGIHDKSTFESACRFAAGGIIGSAFINELSKNENLKQTINNFVEKVIN